MIDWKFPRHAILLAAITFSIAAPALAETESIVLLNPREGITDDWNHRSFGVPTIYKSRVVDGRTVIQAAGENSASGLMREVRFDVRQHAFVEWIWRVDELPRGADIRSATSDDYAASISFIFGRPRMLGSDPPTLMYAWTSSATPQGTIVKSPHHDGTMRVIVVRSGQGEAGTWLNERRNIVKDFRLAFGVDPPPFVEGVAIWSGSDQTQDGVNAYYGDTVVRRE